MSHKSKIKSARRQQRKQLRQQQRRPAGASRESSDLHIKKIERLLGAIEEDALQQRESESPYYDIPWRLLGTLVGTALPVTADSGDFILKLKQFGELLPPCFAKSAIGMIFNERGPADFDRTLSTIQTLYRESRWQSFRCPAISLDAGLAAAMMLTSYPPEFVDGLVPPWDAFLIRLPEGLNIEWDGVKYTEVMLHRYETPVLPSLKDEVPSDVRSAFAKVERLMAERPRERWGLYGMSGDRGFLQGESLLTEQLGLVRRQHLMKPIIPEGDASEGIMVLFARLVAGVCALANPNTTRRTSPDDSPTVEWQLLSRPSQSDIEQETLKKYLNRLKTIGYAMPPTQLDLEQLSARYASDHGSVGAAADDELDDDSVVPH